jgi:hypothetical protein
VNPNSHVLRNSRVGVQSHSHILHVGVGSLGDTWELEVGVGSGSAIELPPKSPNFQLPTPLCWQWKTECDSGVGGSDLGVGKVMAVWNLDTYRGLDVWYPVGERRANFRCSDSMERLFCLCATTV